MLNRVTTVVANHNYGRWVEGCLDAAAASTHPEHQICFVDDGSSDDSVDVVYSRLTDVVPYRWEEVEGVEGRWKETGVPVLLISCNPARGPSAARNVAIRCSWEGSDWFHVLDADDEPRPEKISRLLSAAGESGEVGFVYADYDTVDEAGVKMRNFKEPFSRQRLLGECIVHSGSLVSKKWLGVVGLYDENLRCAEDYDLWLRLSEYSTGVHVPESLTLVRVGSHNSTATVKGEVWQECWKRVAEKTHLRGVGLRRMTA